MYKVRVVFHCGPFSPHAGQFRELNYSFTTEELALKFMVGVQSLPRAKSGPYVVTDYLGRI